MKGISHLLKGVTVKQLQKKLAFKCHSSSTRDKLKELGQFILLRLNKCVKWFSRQSFFWIVSHYFLSTDASRYFTFLTKKQRGMYHFNSADRLSWYKFPSTSACRLSFILIRQSRFNGSIVCEILQRQQKLKSTLIFYNKNIFVHFQEIYFLHLRIIARLLALICLC